MEGQGQVRENPKGAMRGLRSKGKENVTEAVQRQLR